MMPKPVTQKRISTDEKIEASLVLAAVLGAHSIPCARLIGIDILGASPCHKIGFVFTIMICMLTSIQILFQARRRIEQSLEGGAQIRVLPTLALGGILVGLWFVPVFFHHTAAKAVATSAGLAVALLLSSATRRQHGGVSIGNDVIPLCVLAIGFFWTLANADQLADHGADFLAAVAIGSASMHSLSVMADTVQHIWGSKKLTDR